MRKDMTVAMYIFGGVLVVALLFVSSVRPSQSSISRFELRRRQKLRDIKASEALERQDLLAQAATVKPVLQAVFIAGLTSIVSYELGWFLGLLMVVCLIVIIHLLAVQLFARRLALRIYERYELQILAFFERHIALLKIVGGSAQKPKVLSLSSPEELAHLLRKSSAFSDEDTHLIENVLRFRDRSVTELMVPKNKLFTISDSELLGPLVLDDLHKTGHTIFPVTKADHIVGLLDIREHSELHMKESVHVRSVMRSDFVLLGENETLEGLLRVLVASKVPLVFIQNEDGETIGMVSLSDAISALTGWSDL